MFKQTKNNQRAFTIVELAVVIAIIGILIAVSTFAFGNWRERTAINEVKVTLDGAVSAMENSRNFGAGYPVQIPETYEASAGVTLTYVSGDDKNFCIEAQSVAVPSVIYFVDTINNIDEPVLGTCATGPGPVTPGGGAGEDAVALYFNKLSTDGDVSCTLGVNNQAYCWGENGNGQTGNGTTTTPVTLPAAVVQGARPNMTAKSVAAGYRHSCVTSSDDRAYCFGARNQAGASTGALGEQSSSPVPQSAPSPLAVTTAGALSGGKAVQLSPRGGIYTCGIGTDNFAYCWGLANSNWQLGTTAGQTYVPIRINENTVLTGKTLKQITSATWHSCVIASDDWVYCWGNNHRTGTTASPGLGSPVYVGAVLDNNLPSGTKFIQVDAVSTRTCAVSSMSHLYCWGQLATNDLETHLGTLLSGQSGARPIPTAVDLAELPNGGRVRQVALGENHVCVVSTNGKAYCAGKRGAAGTLGDGVTGTDSTNAVPVSQGEMPADATVKYIRAGDDHTCIIASNDKVYCWGLNSSGQLGNGSTTSSAVPVEVDGLP